MLKIFYKETITEKLIQDMKDAEKLDITFCYYNSLVKSELWNEFVELSKSKIIDYLWFSNLLDQDNEGNYIKNWGNLDFLNLIGTKSIKTFKARNCNNLENLKYVENTVTICLEQHIKNKLDLGPIVKFSDTLEKLYLEKNITNFTVLKELKELKFLNIDSLKKFDLLSIAELENLETLDLVRTTFLNTDSFKYLTQVKNIYLYGINSVSDFSFLGFLPNVENITLDRCKKLTRLPDMSNMKSLKHFRLEKVGEIENLSELMNAPSLETFSHFETNNVPDDYQFLKKMKLKDCGIHINNSKQRKEIDKILSDLGY